jgi:hypothetical protein
MDIKIKLALGNRDNGLPYPLRGLSPMSSNFTQAQRDFLNNVKHSVALIDREIQRIREQRIAVCISGFELDWQLISLGATQGVAGANKIGSILNAHTDFQAALTELHGRQLQVPVSNPQNLPKASANSDDPASLIIGTGRPGKPSGSGRSAVEGTEGGEAPAGKGQNGRRNSTDGAANAS